MLSGVALLAVPAAMPMRARTIALFGRGPGIGRAVTTRLMATRLMTTRFAGLVVKMAARLFLLLLLAFRRRRQIVGHGFDLGAVNALDIAQIPAFRRIAERQGDASPAGAR